MKSDKNSCLLTLFVLIDLPFRKEEKIQTGENHVHQGLSKVFVFHTDVACHKCTT